MLEPGILEFSGRSPLRRIVSYILDGTVPTSLARQAIKHRPNFKHYSNVRHPLQQKSGKGSRASTGLVVRGPGEVFHNTPSQDGPLFTCQD